LTTITRSPNALFKHRSSDITDGPNRAPARSYLRAMGLTDDDLSKPFVAIANLASDVTPCNVHLDRWATAAKEGIRAANGTPFEFGTITVSDGISMGTEGMKASLVSREVIADSIETVAFGQRMDGLVTVGGCDKNMPGVMMAMGRVNRPALMVYGGTIRPGHSGGKALDIVSAFQSYGEYIASTITDDERQDIVRHACPGAGACGGMYTANTMASAIESLGMSLPYSSSYPATSEGKQQECLEAGAAIRNLLELDLKPLDILTRAAFENAITLTVILGGSTNAVLHLLAIAKSTDAQLTIDDFQEISDRTPLLADLKPSGQYVMEDLYEVGGVPAVQKMLLREGFLHGDCMTVTGKTLAENLETVPDLTEGQKIIMPVNEPVKETGHLQILYGNLAETGAVAKITGKEGLRFKGPAICYDSEEDCLAGIESDEVLPGNVVVIRYEGPKGGPGMREMLSITGAIMGKGLGSEVALITDGRFSGGSHGFVVGHITPEAQEGGLLALAQNGDTITIDAEGNTLTLEVAEEEIDRRRVAWSPPEYKAKSGVLWKYIRTVSSASEGCVTDA
jgi:dihydroxy-acid dehydratase